MFSWFVNLSLRWKVLLAPGLIILVLAGVGAFSIQMQRANQASVEALLVGPVARAEAVAEFNTIAWQSQVQLYRLIATSANETDTKNIKSYETVALKAISDMVGKLRGLESFQFESADEKMALSKLTELVTKYDKQSRDVVDMADTDAGTAMALMGGALRSFIEIARLADELVDDSKTVRDSQVLDNNAKVEKQLTLLIGIVGSVIAIGCVLSFLIGRGISRPVVQIANAIKRMAEGDFSIKLPELQRKDEVGQISAAYNSACGRLGDMIRAIADSAREVSNATAEISVSTTDLSQRTEEQAASLEETSASMEEISSIVKKNADNAQQANRAASSTRSVADHGGEVVAQAVDAMARIEESSRKISDIIGVIDEIARQTNLLALNAAVEAARAGEAGRGFAVVATEVRSLAQRSSQAAKDIKDLITNSNGQVKDGVDLVNKAGKALGEIVNSIKEVATIVSDIAAASSEQHSGIEHINKALVQMDEVTQQNSALVEENAATARMLEQQAKSMDERVSFFRLEGDAHDDAEPAPEHLESHDEPEEKLKVTDRKIVPAQQSAPKPEAVATKRGPVGRMQAAVATAFQADSEWSDF